MDFSITLAGKQTVLTTSAFKWDSPDPPLSADHLFFSAHTPAPPSRPSGLPLLVSVV